MPDDYGMSYGEAFGSAVRSAKKARKQRRKAAAVKKKVVNKPSAKKTVVVPKTSSRSVTGGYPANRMKPITSKKVAGKAVPSRGSAIRKSDASGYAKRAAVAAKRKER